MAVALGMLLSLPAAALLHRAVEQPAHRLAKRMANQGQRRLTPTAPPQDAGAETTGVRP
jgi:peptidoglycan/LPS O-acetylase OafA/YrhL